MPQPTRSDVHVNKPLTNISIAYIQSAKDFIADKVFPIVPVMKQSDLYFKYDKSYWFRTQAAKRADSTESAGSGYHVDNTPNYYCDVWAVHKDVGDQIRANADMPLDMDRDATMFVTQQLLLRRETQFMNTYMKTGIWTGDPAGDFTPSTKWSVTSSDPMKDVDAEKQIIKSQTGFLPNTLVVTADVFFALRNNLTVLDRIKYTQRGIVTEDLLASLFGVDKFLVASAVVDSGVEGANAQSYGYLAANCALLVYAAPAASILQPSGGYIFSWQGLFGAGAQGNRISTFRIEEKKTDRVEGEMAFSMKLVASDVGVFFTAVLS